MKSLLLILLTLGFYAGAQEPANVRERSSLPLNKKLTFKIQAQQSQVMNLVDLGQSMTQGSTVEQTYALSITPGAGGKGKQVRYELLTTKVDMGTPLGKMLYDSSKDEKPEKDSPLYPMVSLVGSPINAVLSKEERAVRVLNLDELQKHFGIKPGDENTPFTEQYFLNMVNNVLNSPFAESTSGRKVGDQWERTVPMPLEGVGQLSSDVSFVFMGVGDRKGYTCDQLKISGKMKDFVQDPEMKKQMAFEYKKGKQVGQMWIDQSSGVEVEFHSLQEIELNISQPIKVETSINSKEHRELIAFEDIPSK